LLSQNEENINEKNIIAFNFNSKINSYISAEYVEKYNRDIKEINECRTLCTLYMKAALRIVMLRTDLSIIHCISRQYRWIYHDFRILHFFILHFQLFYG